MRVHDSDGCAGTGDVQVTCEGGSTSATLIVLLRGARSAVSMEGRTAGWLMASLGAYADGKDCDLDITDYDEHCTREHAGRIQFGLAGINDLARLTVTDEVAGTAVTVCLDAAECTALMVPLGGFVANH